MHADPQSFKRKPEWIHENIKPYRVTQVSNSKNVMIDTTWETCLPTLQWLVGSPASDKGLGWEDGDDLEE